MEGQSATELGILLVILVAAFLAPLVSDHLTRWVVIPAAVLEIVFGILLGPAGFGLVRETETVAMLANLGLALLMFMAGYEIDFARIAGTPLRRAIVAWFCSVALGLGFAWIWFGTTQTTLIIGLALTTTALGTVLPILRDAGVLKGPFGTRFLASGTVGEFGPIVLIALLLSGFRPLTSTAMLALFFLLAGVAAWRATRPPSERLGRLIRVTLGSSAQLAVRLCMLLIVLLVWVASTMQLDALLGAFAAGVIVRLMLATNHPGEAQQVESKMDAIGFGFLIPLFFVVTGVRFDLGALMENMWTLALVPMFLLAFLVVRGGPVYLLASGDLPPRGRSALILFCSTALPLVVVLTTIGTHSGALDSAIAAALVGAAMLSVLVYPQFGSALLRTTRTPAS